MSNLEDMLRFPKYFQIETTRLCNARCPFCAIDQWDKSTPFMSDELFRKIADEIISQRDWIKFVDLQRAGEPLLDKKIYERVAYMKDGGVTNVVLTTNASSLTERNARRLLEAGIDELMLSIDSVQKDKYEKLRVGLPFEKVMDNIRGFFALRDQIRPSCMVRVRGVSFHDLSDPEDAADLASWESFWEPLRKPHDRIYMKRAHNWGNQKSVEGHSPEYSWVYHPCIIPWSTMHITAMGTVGLCPQDYDGLANLGNINEQSIAEVWNGEKFAEVRRLHATGARNDISFCQGCLLFDEEFTLERERNVASSRDGTLEALVKNAKRIA
ncbi:Predicted Fe-S oxidoreductase [Paramagnetospirillum magneticum AMB-1]|uniref:Predicted Fe-S oxidoreductase n=1 Tax=Paramagnetospirillum magneticum (strain ATCC 700264 / AMB-1) TaxID=342108 RepID=Q2WB99_PARM1|nr:Predicted Fe-S oxidoreductase [Paramagnetospirillum magneticum AMB-1]